jgi:hypothetical protein
LDDTSNAAAACTDQTDQTMQNEGDGTNNSATDQPVINTQAPSAVPTTPAGNFDQDMNHLMNHLGDLKAFLTRWEHKVEGKVGEVVAYLKANL